MFNIIYLKQSKTNLYLKAHFKNQSNNKLKSPEFIFTRLVQEFLQGLPLTLHPHVGSALKHSSWLFPCSFSNSPQTPSIQGNRHFCSLLCQRGKKGKIERPKHNCDFPSSFMIHFSFPILSIHSQFFRYILQFQVFI